MVEQGTSGYWHVYAEGRLIGTSESESGAFRILRAWERTHGLTRRFLDR